MSLPQPVEQPVSSPPYEKQSSQAIEQGKTGRVSGSSPTSNTPQASQLSAQQSASPAGSSSVSSGSPQIADDVDLIEKEWVERAKRIVEQTRNDPHRQSDELHATAADYQKKRFNRDIDLGDAA